MSVSVTKPARPVPRWLHAWAVVTAVWAFAVITLGALVSTFQVGMADPIWPTQPWFLLVNGWQEPRAGFLIEHTHRFAAFGIGGFVMVLALGLWWFDPRPATRWIGLGAMVAMLLSFAMFHSAMRAQLDKDVVEWPKGPAGAMVIAFGIAGLTGLLGMQTRSPGSGLRFLGVLALAGVIVQGLLGGFRVKLNAKLGIDLAAVHGIFAQIVFSVLVSLALLTGRVRTWEPATDAVRKRLNRFAVVLVAVVLTQLVWGALIRHSPTPLSQRLHLLTAFGVVAVAVWLLRAGFGSPEGRASLGIGGWVLGFLLAAQVTLGVEAWMGKFGQYMLPELVPITREIAVVRTLHALIGNGILATAVALAVRTGVRVPSPVLASSAAASRSGRMPQPILAGAPQLGETTS